MIHNRKNTSVVVDTWRNYLSGNKRSGVKKRLNESPERDRNEHFEALISDLTECEWDDTRIDTLIDLLQRCNPSNEELEMIAYGSSEPMSDEAREFQQDRFIEREPLEADEDLGM